MDRFSLTGDRMALRFGLGCGLVVAGLSGLVATSVGLAQAAASPKPHAAATTLQGNSRNVLMDVTVTDKKGNPVHGLPKSAFHVFDNGEPQKLRSVVEYRDRPTTDTARVPEAANMSAQRRLQAAPKAINVILLDLSFVSPHDRTYLYHQMQRAFAKVPPGQSFAVYSMSGRDTEEEQSFTDDTALLLAAIRHAMLRPVSPDAMYASGRETLHELALDLASLPGRKNVLWFSGGLSLDVLRVPMRPLIYVNPQSIYDELEASRIALYPIDMLGITVGDEVDMLSEQQLMKETAEATGGVATLSSDNLAASVLRTVENDGSYYTLRYTPNDLKFNGKWHKVEVKVDLPGGYHLHYPHGYYDNGPNAATPANDLRSMLRADGEKGQDESTGAVIAPISLTVSALPASTANATSSAVQTGGSGANDEATVSYTLTFALPVAEFRELESSDDDPADREVRLGIALVALNQSGKTVQKRREQIVFASPDTKGAINPGDTVPATLRVDLPYGQDYIYAAVWDTTTRRTGRIELSVTVPKPFGKE